FVEFAHAVLTAMLLGRDARDREDGGFRGMPDTAAALLVCCREEGLRMPDPTTADPAVQQDSEQIGRWMRVMHDLEQLVAIGALDGDRGRVRGPEARLVAVVALLREGDCGQRQSFPRPERTAPRAVGAAPLSAPRACPAPRVRRSRASP